MDFGWWDDCPKRQHGFAGHHRHGARNAIASTGRASLASDETIGASCEVPFRIVEAPKAAPPIVIHDAPMKADEVEFHMNVRDILFDYDKYALRPRLDAAARRCDDVPEVAPVAPAF